MSKHKKKRAIAWCLLFVMVVGLDSYFVKTFVLGDSVKASTEVNKAKDLLSNEANSDNLLGAKQSGTSEQAESVSTNKVLLDVPYINQTKKYINGCESVSTVMNLQYLGIDITVDDFIDKYLDMGEVPYHDKDGVYWGSNPWKVYPGNPRNETGWGCYAPVITRALKKFINQDKYEVKELYNVEVSKLCSDYIDKRIPVIFWATIDMKTPYKGSTWKLNDTKESFTWIRPMHCLLLVGYDDTYYYFNDPWNKKATKYKKAAVKRAYEGLGEQAVVIVKK